MKMKLVICITLLFVTLVINSNVYSLNQSKESFQNLKESIQALDITRDKSQKKLFTLDQFQDQSLHNEYSVFIEYLSFRIKKYCSQISQLYGENLLKGLPCQFNKSQNQKLDENNYVTAEEQVQSLDDELLNALGNFDEMLLEEHEKIAQTQTSINKTSSDQNSSAGKNASNQENSSAEEKASNNQSKQASEKTQSQDGKNNKEKNKQNQTQSKYKSKEDKQYKRKKIDINDDDIVARQLKEAAENENDPELKEKLWDEYYKYKKNINKR